MSPAGKLKLRSVSLRKPSGPPRQGTAPEGTAPESAAAAPDNAWGSTPVPRVQASALGSIQGGITAAKDPAPLRPEKPAVRLRRLAGVASWALVLVLAGVATAVVGLFRVFGESPAWFTPAFITCGVIGMLLTMMAFATLRFKGVPWMFMAAATITLFAAFVMLRA
ncbi:hypothetical protein [Glycomyces algeriensis]|uniref:Uncharacterized protein n=1 Tax=Glycomyces algeriensis TaxID=256037 RepID=A0A9W6G669_9ACTN|nr:hypothetical protein [Glycomyces algeriensis]MDA1366063.1 hypothetical protein [Glycomyces algeriensis]MDR7349170.1 membrane protein YdbS with pleckstrin-like domain [Glycomyces algeriensis]GLI41870.1 hypothetical protein GALLR39Z86_17200 [Glycomyces algeriensis]